MLPLWEDNFSVHNEDIDSQHKILFALAHKAYQMERTHTSRLQIKQVLTELFEYMKTHFTDEEKYMEQIGYPKLAEHKNLHKYIVRELTGMIKTIHSANDMKEKLKIISQEWLLQHILQEDMQIEKFRVAEAVKNIHQPKATEKATVFTQKENKEEKQTQFEYVCLCPNKTHILSEAFHNKVQNRGAIFKCKICMQPISLK